MIAPLRLSFTVACSAQHAFATWTARTSLWWPTTHTVSGDRGLEVRIEPWVGGRIFERTPAGREADWGEVTAWEPPRRLAYRWHLNAPRANATDVEITFTELAAGTTQVEIVHGGWERFGDAGPGWRDANRGGWSGVLPLYIAACTAPSS
jgi:uncharacterized protein YndB with AHSA1/START domain